MRTAIETSDIGTNYEIAMHPPGVSLIDHFIALLRHMAEAKTDLVLRLEDDIDVNRHIVHNLTHWPAIHDDRFLIGWAFDPNGSCRTIHDHIYQRAASNDRWMDNDVAFSQAAVMWTRDVHDIANACAVFWKLHPELDGAFQDMALSNAPRILKRGRVVVHAPSLTEHLIDLPSQLAHSHAHEATSNGTFIKDWKRA